MTPSFVHFYLIKHVHLYFSIYNSNFVNEIQYTGAIYDELTGLLYLNARFYDPSTGRFITQDSYRGEKNDADTWHLYAYCANNPINYVDPSGHLAERIIGAFVGATVGGAMELAAQGLEHLFRNKMKIASMKTFKANWNRIYKEMAWGTISGLMLTTHFKRNVQALVAGATNSLKGIVSTKTSKSKVKIKNILLDFGIGFLSGYLGGDGFGAEFYKKAIFYRGGYYKYEGVVYNSLPILKKPVLKQFVKSLTSYVGSAIVSRINIA